MDTMPYTVIPPPTPGQETWLSYEGECPRCGGPVEERQCKLVCILCGAMRSCDDP